MAKSLEEEEQEPESSGPKKIDGLKRLSKREDRADCDDFRISCSNQIFLKEE
jgi:hypothetical protein